MIIVQAYHSYFTASEKPLNKKPVTSWNSDNVQDWLKTLDQNTQETLGPVFKEKDIINNDFFITRKLQAVFYSDT